MRFPTTNDLLLMIMAMMAITVSVAATTTSAAIGTAIDNEKQPKQQRGRELGRQQYSSSRSRRFLKQLYKKEWMYMSANNTRKVYNFGVGSLLSWSGTQYSEQTYGKKHKYPEIFESIDPLYPVTVTGIQRKFDYCWRYTAVAAVSCDDISQDNTKTNDACAAKKAVMGAAFELKQEDYPSIRSRESSYAYIEVYPDMDMLPSDVFDRDGYYFAWATGNNNDNENYDPIFDCTNSTGRSKWEPMISQSYWDFMIGGILAWDGQLTNNNMYTWDFDAELSASKTNDDATMKEFQTSVYKMPSLSLTERKEMAIAFVKSTSNAPNIPWMDDRKCPYTGNSIITPLSMLDYPDGVFDGYHKVPDAIGTISPIASSSFYDYVDTILKEGGWTAQNDIDSRISSDVTCSKIFNDNNDDVLGIAYDRSYSQTWRPNPYYNTVMDWRRQYHKQAQEEYNNDLHREKLYITLFGTIAVAALLLFVAVTITCLRRRKKTSIKQNGNANDDNSSMELTPSTYTDTNNNDSGPSAPNNISEVV